MTPLRACIELAIATAPDLPSLAQWWHGHKPALRALAPLELAEVLVVKDHRKRMLEMRSNDEGTPGQQPRLL